MLMAQMEKEQVSLVVGCGFMGKGIASSFVASGRIVCLFDARGQAYCEEVKSEIVEQVRNFRKEILGQQTSSLLELSSLVYTCPDSFLEDEEEFSDFLASMPATTNNVVDFIWEAVFEDLQVKCEVFAKIQRRFAGQANPPIICSNTSSICLSAMKTALAATLPDPRKSEYANLVVAHFVGPALHMPFVELWCEQPKGSTIAAVKSFLSSCGKKPVVLQKEVAGFLHARLQAVLMRECMALIEGGVCSAQDIDDTVTYGFGRRYNQIGPMTQADFIGADLLVWYPLGFSLILTRKGNDRKFVMWNGKNRSVVHTFFFTVLLVMRCRCFWWLFYDFGCRLRSSSCFG